MNEEVRSKAKELAELIAGSKEYICMRMAEDAASQDKAITDLAARYYEKHEEMEALTSAENPDFEKMGVLSNEMSALQDQMKELPLAKAMQNARNAFTEMMNMVNRELQQVLAPGEAQQGTCTGNCSGCHGCDH